MKEIFTLNMKRWNPDYSDTSTPLKKTLDTKETRTFHSPYTAEMKYHESDDENEDVDREIVFSQEQSLFFQIDQHTKLSIQNLQSDLLSHLKEKPEGSWVLNKKSLSGSTLSPKPNSARVGGSSVQNIAPLNGRGKLLSIYMDFIAELLSRLTEQPVFTAHPVMSYQLQGKDVRYFIGSKTDNFDPITLSGGEINSIFIGGYDQSQGKWGFISDSAKIGEASWASVRATINKNIAPLLRNRSSDTIIGGIKYVTGDLHLSGSVDGWKTLVIYGGDLTFQNTFNPEKKNIGIIVLKDADGKGGNVYITPDVAFIGGTIFADGSVESVTKNGEIFPKSTRTRSKLLKHQLVFYGGVYSQNTVGGAILGKIGDKYILPGNVKTDDIHKAVRYDLSFLRMKSLGKDKDEWTKKYNAGRSESVVILLNQEAIQSPPPGFQN